MLESRYGIETFPLDTRGIQEGRCDQCGILTHWTVSSRDFRAVSGRTLLQRLVPHGAKKNNLLLEQRKCLRPYVPPLLGKKVKRGEQEKLRKKEDKCVSC